MACTKETYIAITPWTQSQLADLFRDAFIDAGLMTDWHDSFLSGSIENRILAVEYDDTKTYGISYYWFKFTASGAWLSMVTGWDGAGNAPTGAQYLDYVSTETSSTSGSWRITEGVSTAATLELVRYASGIDSDQSWFTLKSGANKSTFTIVKPQMTLQPWMDLAKGSFCGFSWLKPDCGGSPAVGNFPFANLSFRRGPGLRRDLVLGSALYNTVSIESYNGPTNIPMIAYGATGYISNSYSSNAEIGFSYSTGAGPVNFGNSPGAIILPNNFTGNNPAFASNSNPVYHSMPFMPYINENLPSDFGITFQYASNSFSQGDRLIISAGIEEWEVIDFDESASAVTGASPLFVARMV